uniref:Uncharacterized protein n=1 Tax=Tanacetum cinerariifolium TaxID=118510 RepID=A0A6L2LJJ8_TANCI|nr:hypothetical protein [Tanacetum cinerariifolium]
MKSPSYSLPPTNFSKLLMILLVFSLLSIAWIMAAALSLSLFLQIDYGRYFIRITLRRSFNAVRTSVELLLVAFDTQLKVFYAPLDHDASCKHSKRDVKIKTFFDCQISQLSLYKKQQHIFDVLNAKPFKIAFLELIKLIIVSSHRYPIQVLVAMPLYNLEFSDNDDSSLRIHIASRLLVNSKTVELLTFTPPMGDSPEGMLVIAYWFFNPHCPRHQVFYPLDMPVIYCLRLRNRSSILAA